MIKNRKLMVAVTLLILCVALSGCAQLNDLRGKLPGFKPEPTASLLGVELKLGGHIHGMRVYINNKLLMESGHLLNPATGEYQDYPGKPISNPWAPEIWLFPVFYSWENIAAAGEPGNPLKNTIAVELTRNTPNDNAGVAMIFAFTATAQIYPHKNPDKPYKWLTTVNGEVNDVQNWYKMDYNPTEFIVADGPGPIMDVFWFAMSVAWGHNDHLNTFGQYSDAFVAWGAHGAYWKAPDQINSTSKTEYMRVDFWLEHDEDGIVRVVPPPAGE